MGGGPIGATVGATAGGLAGKEIAEKLHDSTMEHLDNLKEPRSPASMDLRLHEEKAAQQANVKSDSALKARQEAREDAVDMGVTAGTLIGGGVGALVGVVLLGLPWVRPLGD